MICIDRKNGSSVWISLTTVASVEYHADRAVVVVILRSRREYEFTAHEAETLMEVLNANHDSLMSQLERFSL